MEILKKDKRFEEVAGCCAEILLVDKTKITFNSAVLKVLGISQKSIDKEGIAIKLDKETKKLVLYKDSKNKGYIVHGTYNEPEIYCEDICEALFELFDGEYTNTDIIFFPFVWVNKSHENHTPCIEAKVIPHVTNPNMCLWIGGEK